MDTDKIINEWFYRLPKGYANYPYSDDELAVLHKVLEENDFQLDQAFLDAKPVDEEIDTNLPEEDKIEYIRDVLTNEVKLEDVLIDYVIEIYEKLSTSEKKEFDKNFRSLSVEKFVSTNPKVFEKFYNVRFQAKVAGGIGRGEVQILLAVEDSTTGGTQRKDIVMPNGEYEVKELDSDAFRPAKSGRAFNFDLTREIIYFYDDIIEPYNTMTDPATTLKEMVSEKSYKDIDELVSVIENNFNAQGDKSKIQSAYEWNQSNFNAWFEGFKQIRDIMSRINLDIKDTRIQVQTGAESDAFWISPEDAAEIEKSSGTDDSAMINVGTKITNVTNNRKIWFNRLKRFPFISNPEAMVDDLKQVRDSFFEGILGLIYFKKKEPGKPYLAATPDEFVVYQVSQGQYRYRLASHSSTAKYNFLKQQVSG